MAQENPARSPSPAAGLTFRESLCFYGEFFTGEWRRVWWSVWLHAIDIVPLLLLPLITMVIVDYFIPAGNKWAIGMAFLLIIVIGVFNTLFHIAFRYNTMRLLSGISRKIRNKIIERLQMLSVAYHSHQHTGRYYSKLTSDVDRIQNFGNVCLNLFSQIIVFGTFSVMVLFYVNYEITLMILLGIPFFQLLVHFFRNRMRLSRHDERMARENLSISVGHFLQASLLTRQHGAESYEMHKIADVNERVSEKTVDAEADVALFGVVNTFATVLFHFIVIAICAFYVMNGELTFGGLLLFTACVSRIINQVTAIINIFPVITQFTESVASIKEIIVSPDIEDNRGKKNAPRLEGRITFDDVSFQYSETGASVLRHFSIDIAPGTTVGIVGKSGSGKSTFINLILGLYRTRQGTVKIDDLPVNEMDMRTVRRQIGVVSQTPILFSGTVFANLVHAYPNMPFEKVIEAARQANAHDFICQLEHGYDTEVGEKGVLLSGGQKQRLALARAILRHPAILILDEATSALDSESERLVQDAINHLDRKITKLIIAHRLSTIRNADIILVFDNGCIRESGTHAELMARNGLYAELLRYQNVSDIDLNTTQVFTRTKPTSEE